MSLFMKSKIDMVGHWRWNLLIDADISITPESLTTWRSDNSLRRVLSYATLAPSKLNVRATSRDLAP